MDQPITWGDYLWIEVLATVLIPLGVTLVIVFWKNI